MTDLDAIVLDLDDTLLDTTGILLPVADRRAVRAMRAAGLALEEDAACARVTELRRAGRGGSVFRDLAAERRAPEPAGAAGEDAFFRYEVPPLDLDPRVARALDRLALFAPLALLTLGVPRTQRRKLEELGIDGRFVDREFVDLFGGGTKTAGLARLLDRHGWRAERVVVVGDSLAGDVAAAVANGCPGVLVRAGGERAHDVAPEGVRPWAAVDHVDELPALLSAAGYSERLTRRPDPAS